MMTTKEFIEKMDTLSKRCVHKKNKAKIGKIKRRISSLRLLTDEIFVLSQVVADEDAVEWFYERYLEINKKKKR